VKILVKLGGTLLDDPSSLTRLAGELAAVARREHMVVVHGGGKQMTRFLAERGIESRFVNGLRITTPEVLDAVLKIFAGSVNTTLVAALRAKGAQAVGLTGVDAGLVDAEPFDPALGSVGHPVQSDPRLLNVLVNAGFLPVVACVAGDSYGSIYNVNGDQMAVACARAFGAEKLIFLTDVDGVRDASGSVRTVLDSIEARELIRSGTASGGMQAKLEAALTYITANHISVPRPDAVEVRICSGSQPEIIDKILSGSSPVSQVGTRLISSHA
jgi:acetylglutamate kinase